MAIIKAFTTKSGFEVEMEDELTQWLVKNGYKPQIKNDALGVRITTGVISVETLIALLREFYGKNPRVTLRVFKEGSSKEYQDYQL